MISIIVPIYNSEKWLKRCLDSIVSQSYKDIEIILVNDGSTDSSLDICEYYAEKDERIIVIDKENGGVSDARNEGIKNASGEFIQFVDSDDYIDSNMCEKLVYAISDADLVLCGLNIWQRNILLRTPHLPMGRYNFKNSIDIYFKLRKINLGPCNKLYRKNKLTQYFRKDLSLGEDTLFILDYMKSIDKIAVIPDCLYNVVLDNENSLNRSSKMDKIELLIDQRKIEEKFLIDIYGADCDMSKMYEQYLLLVHSFFLLIAKEDLTVLKEKIDIYVNCDLLHEKIIKSLPKRADYRLFRFLYTKKFRRLIYFYFRLKVKLLNIK